MFWSEDNISECDIENIREIAEEVFDEHDDWDEAFEIIIEKCAKELDLELLLCSCPTCIFLISLSGATVIWMLNFLNQSANFLLFFIFEFLKNVSFRRSPQLFF